MIHTLIQTRLSIVSATVAAVYFFCALNAWAQQASAPPELELWYQQPAQQWEDALPVGNGRMGAMVFGKTDTERIQLNEESMWPGPETPAVNSHGTPEDLKRIRDLVLAGKHHEADSAIVRSFSRLDIKRSHQTLGDLWIESGNKDTAVSDYRRSLDLRTGIARTTWKRQGIAFSREVFCSAPDQVLVVRLKANRPKALAFHVRLDRPLDTGAPTHNTVASPNTLTMTGRITQRSGELDSKPVPGMSGAKFLCVCRVLGDGDVVSGEGELQISGGSDVTLLLTASTGGTQAELAKQHDVKVDAVSELRQRHVRDHRELMDRCVLDLGGHELARMPTDRRIVAIREGMEDPALQALLFQYGRYLLVASSRPGTQPANLQGLWNPHILAPWNADYHLNINLQMNYWPANVTGLGECNEPLFQFMQKLAQRGAETARAQYGCRGWVAHHATDLWATPWMRARMPYWGSWIHGGGWLCQHLWSHYTFTGDKVFLKDTAWPLLSGQSLFYLDWLIEKDGRLISMPETSPENSFLSPEDDKPAAVCAAAAMGQQIITEVFTNTLAAAEELGIENPLVREIRAALPKLEKGTNIGPDGRLLEWGQPFKEASIGHRHMSHLYAFHPGHAITQGKTPKLMEAVRKSIATRVKHGGVGVGWTRAWAINVYARLHAGNTAHHQLNELLKTQTLDNLFSSVFGIKRKLFQIEANFGTTAGVAEMLLQSHDDRIDLLPALPDAWATGSVKGLHARGGFEVDIQWEAGELSRATVRSSVGGICRLRTDVAVTVKHGDSTIGTSELEAGTVTFPTGASQEYSIERVKRQE